MKSKMPPARGNLAPSAPRPNQRRVDGEEKSNPSSLSATPTTIDQVTCRIGPWDETKQFAPDGLD